MTLNCSFKRKLGVNLKSLDGKPLDETVYGYRYVKGLAGASHHDGSITFTMYDDLIKWLKLYKDNSSELRVVDKNDYMVLHIENGKILYPPKE
jgi:hypothetical protein